MRNRTGTGTGTGGGSRDCSQPSGVISHGWGLSELAGKP